MKSLFLIYNPISGKKKSVNYLSSVVDYFSAKDFKITIYASQGKNDIYNKMKGLKNEYDYILVIGGDGTLNEAVRGSLSNSLIPLAYYPAGSTNDFAHALKISSNIEKACGNILKNRVINSDVGTLNKHRFIYVAAFGSVSEVSYSTPQASKNILGHNAYILEGFKQLLSMKSFKLKIEIDDGEIIEDEFCYGMVSNSTHIGGMRFYKNDDVIFNDGYFECLFIKKINNPYDLQTAFASFTKKAIKNNRMVYRFRCQSLDIKSEEDIKWTCDGEFAGKYKSIRITVMKGVINYLR